MGMPQKEVFENHILVMKEGNGASHFCYRGVANLIQFMAGGVNELWFPPTFFLELIPTQGGNHISSTGH
jgi:hypothetical protein